MITSRAPESIDGWTNHINGATALLDIRGTDQFKTSAGLRLFLYLRYQIVGVVDRSFDLKLIP